MISRVQAQVLHRDEGYWIENLSAAIPILHNGRPLSSGMRVLLREGDELRVGGYTLRASFEGDETSATILRGRTVITHLTAGAGSVTKGPTTTAPTPTPGSTVDPWANASGPTEVSGDDLWRGFLEGAGITTPQPTRLSVDLLGTIGSMLKIAIDGLYRLVAMRALAKDDLQAQMTMIQVRDTNPLKFAPDAGTALQLMLKPPARGFLPGPAAVRDALVELESHQAAVTAGMRSALAAVLDRFDPLKLEATLGAQSMLEALRPGRHKARLWELYLERFRSLRREAQEDFQHSFGRAFREAYDAQTRHPDLAAPRPPSSSSRSD
jgi:FHA domain-containing protein